MAGQCRSCTKLMPGCTRWRPGWTKSYAAPSSPCLRIARSWPQRMKRVPVRELRADMAKRAERTPAHAVSTAERRGGRREEPANNTGNALDNQAWECLTSLSGFWPWGRVVFCGPGGNGAAPPTTYSTSIIHHRRNCDGLPDLPARGGRLVARRFLFWPVKGSIAWQQRSPRGQHHKQARDEEKEVYDGGRNLQGGTVQDQPRRRAGSGRDAVGQRIHRREEEL